MFCLENNGVFEDVFLVALDMSRVQNVRSVPGGMVVMRKAMANSARGCSLLVTILARSWTAHVLCDSRADRHATETHAHNTEQARTIAPATS